MRIKLPRSTWTVSYWDYWPWYSGKGIEVWSFVHEHEHEHSVNIYCWAVNAFISFALSGRSWGLFTNDAYNLSRGISVSLLYFLFWHRLSRPITLSVPCFLIFKIPVTTQAWWVPIVCNAWICTTNGVAVSLKIIWFTLCQIFITLDARRTVIRNRTLLCSGA